MPQYVLAGLDDFARRTRPPLGEGDIEQLFAVVLRGLSVVCGKVEEQGRCSLRYRAHISNSSLGSTSQHMCNNDYGDRAILTMLRLSVSVTMPVVTTVEPVTVDVRGVAAGTTSVLDGTYVVV